MYYCSPECQKVDWKLHEPICKVQQAMMNLINAPSNPQPFSDLAQWADKANVWFMMVGMKRFLTIVAAGSLRPDSNWLAFLPYTRTFIKNHHCMFQVYTYQDDVVLRECVVQAASLGENAKAIILPLVFTRTQQVECVVPPFQGVDIISALDKLLPSTNPHIDRLIFGMFRALGSTHKLSPHVIMAVMEAHPNNGNVRAEARILLGALGITI